jgi:hypothetical protein
MDRSGGHALCSGMQRPKNFAHVPTWILHRCLNRFEPIALASGVTIGVHDEKRHGNSHGLRFEQRQDLVLRIEVPREAKDCNFFLGIPYTLDEVSVGIWT